MADRVYLFDTTLRDGAQTRGVDFSAADKALIARDLDWLGIDYIEGGWPGSNPTDDAFFRAPPRLGGATLTAFGMTRRAGRSAANDPTLSAVLDAGTPAVCLFGKSWDFQVRVALEISLDDNLAMIGDSIGRATAMGREAMFDAEHFFDGYKADPAYAMACLEAARAAGARWMVLCDTNGGTLPGEVGRIVEAVTAHIPGDRLGIHAHNDTENAVANSLAAVAAGVRQVQGTLNGLGERCGNANLVALIPSLLFKCGYNIGVDADRLRTLTAISRRLDERLHRAPNRHAAYVGAAAFTHKGGAHVSAVRKDRRTYEHISPEKVGNRRHIVVSDQAGRATLLTRLEEAGLGGLLDESGLRRLVAAVKDKEHAGYAYDGAEASFELLAHRAAGDIPAFFRLDSFRVEVERRHNARGHLTTVSQAVIKITVGDRSGMQVAEGNGPVNALDAALRKALLPVFPALDKVRLVDFKVRILTPRDATAAVTRVVIESADDRDRRWSTVGISANIIDAAYEALSDAIVYELYRVHRAAGPAGVETAGVETAGADTGHTGSPSTPAGAAGRGMEQSVDGQGRHVRDR